MIVAGAGFGKSSLLAQACDENAARPAGRRLLARLRAGRRRRPRRFAARHAPPRSGPTPRASRDAGDDDPAALAGAAGRRRVAAVAAPGVPGASTTSTRSATARRPRAAGRPGRRPAGQRPPGAQRARSTRRCPWPGWWPRAGSTGIDEGDLAFGDDELAAFAALRRVPVDRLGDLGGWPALVELRAAAAGDTIDDFLAEEVLAALGPATRRGRWRRSPPSAAPTRPSSTP